MKQIKEFYAALRNYPMDKKWMQFDFYFRQPFGLALSAILFLIAASAGMMSTSGVIISVGQLLVWLVLLFFVFKREKYSYPCWICVLVIDVINGVITASSNLNRIFDVVLVILLIFYYEKRKAFFMKETPQIIDEK